MVEEPKEPQTAQVPVSEPITPAPIEPFDPAHDKPLPPAEAQAPSEPAPSSAEATERAQQPVSEATPKSTPSEPLQTAQINPEEVEKAAQAASEPAPAPQPQAPAPPATTTPSTKPNSRELLAKGRAKVQEKKQKKLDKIMELLNIKDKVSNADVEKLFRVSDATATRYLSALQKQGKIRKVGKTGRSVFYAKV